VQPFTTSEWTVPQDIDANRGDDGRVRASDRD
jgi:hypothetical protein